MFAAREGNIEAVQTLLENGASIKIKNINNTDALILAHKNGHRKVVALLANSLLKENK